MKFTLGQNVVYTDSFGKIKTAIVTAVSGSGPGHVQAPESGKAHLHIFSFSPTHEVYHRLDVKHRSQVDEWTTDAFFETVEEWNTRQAALADQAAAESLASGDAMTVSYNENLASDPY